MLRVYFKYSTAVVLLFIFSCLMYSCRQTDAVEPFNNTSVKTFSDDTLFIPYLQPGQTVTGDLKFKVDQRLLLSPTDMVILLVDGRFFEGVDPNTLEADLPTHLFSEGPHTFSIGLVDHKKDNGLLNLTYEPYKKYTTKIVIDNTRPNPVTVKSAVYDNKILRLEWSQCNDKNFYSYEIKRYDKDNNGALIATIHDRTVTAFTDSSAPEVYGRSAGYYSVSVNNRAEYANSSNYKFDYGTPFPFPVSLSYNASYDPLNNEIYAAYGNTIRAISCIDNSITRDLISINPEFNNRLYGFFLNCSRTKLFVVWFNNNQNSYAVTRFDLATFKEEKSFSLGIAQLSSTLYPAADNAGRIYIKDSQYLYIFDSETGAQLKKMQNDNHYYLLNMSPDGKYLYGYYTNHSGSSQLEKFTVTGNDLISAGIINSNSSDDMILSRDGKKIYLLCKKLCQMEVYNSESFSLEGTIRFSTVPYASANTFYVSNGFVYASLFEGGQYKIVKFSASSYASDAIAKWKFYISPGELLVSDDNKFLYTFSPFNDGTNNYENWIVKIK